MTVLADHGAPVGVGAAHVEFGRRPASGHAAKRAENRFDFFGPRDGCSAIVGREPGIVQLDAFNARACMAI